MFYSADKYAHFQMTSFPETKIERFVKSSELAGSFVKFSHTNISRVYPKGSRVDSSNYDPTPMWCAGSQLVSLNYQTPGQYICIYKQLVMVVLLQIALCNSTRASLCRMGDVGMC